MATPYQDRSFAAPIVDASTEHFWHGTREGRFRIKTCDDCGRHHWYPRALCPYCFSEATRWLDASGMGTIYSVSVTRRAEPGPFALAYVALDEGVTVLTHIVDCDLDEVRIGDRVRVCFKPAEGGAAVPAFRPA